MSKKNLLVFAADTHLCQCAWKRHVEISGDSYRSFSQIVNFCLSHADQTAGLVLGGDVFDGPPTSTDVEFYLRCVQELSTAGIKILAIQGQHGRSRGVPWTSIDPRVMWLHGLQPQLLPFDRYISGIDNLSPDLLQEALKVIGPKTDILVMHQACKGALPEIDGSQNWDLNPEWVPRHVKLVLLGDIHKVWETVIEHKPDQLDPQGSKTRLIYSGSTAMQSVDEDPRKSFLVVNLETLAVQRESINTRPFMTLMANNEDEVQLAIQTIKKQAPETLVVLRYDSRIPDVEERCRAANKEAVYIFRLMPLEHFDLEVPNAEGFEVEKITLTSCLDRAVIRNEKPQLHSLIYDLLTDRDVRKTLAEHKAKILGAPA